MSERRDRLACRLANFALRLASPRYRAMIGGSIRYGLAAAQRDEEEEREPPTLHLVEQPPGLVVVPDPDGPAA